MLGRDRPVVRPGVNPAPWGTVRRGSRTPRGKGTCAAGGLGSRITRRAAVVKGLRSI